MSQLVSYSPNGSDLRTADDFTLINQLLKNPRYVIPERLRNKAISCIEGALDDDGNDIALKLKAIQTMSQLDKHNIDLVKIAAPKRIEQIDPRKCNDEELLKLVKEVVKKLPREINHESVTDGID